MGEDQEESVTYLKQTVGPVLTRAFYDLAAAQPADAVAYLGTWLHQFVEAEKADLARKAASTELAAEREVAAAERAKVERERQAAEEARKAREAAVTGFQEDLSGRHTDAVEEGMKDGDEVPVAGFAAEFQQLVDATHTLVQPTVSGHGAVYMAQVEESDEQQQLHYINVAAACENHGYLQDKILAGGQGVSWEAFKPVEVEQEEGAAPLTVYNSVHVEDVVNDSVGEGNTAVHFWSVTRLGSLLVIPVIVPNCLTQAALDQAKAFLEERQKKLDEVAAAQEAAPAPEGEEADGEPAENPLEAALAELAAPELTAETSTKYAVYVDTLNTEKGIAKKHQEMLEGLCTAFGECKKRYDTYLVWQQAEAQKRAVAGFEATQSAYLQARAESEGEAARRGQELKESKGDASAEELALIDAQTRYEGEQELLGKQEETVLTLKSRPVIGDGIPQLVAAVALLAGMPIHTVLTRGIESVNWEQCRLAIPAILEAAKEATVAGARTGLHPKQLLTNVRTLAGAVDAAKLEDKPETEPLLRWLQAAMAYREIDLKIRKSAEERGEDDDFDAVEVEPASG